MHGCRHENKSSTEQEAFALIDNGKYEHQTTSSPSLSDCSVDHKNATAKRTKRITENGGVSDYELECSIDPNFTCETKIKIALNKMNFRPDLKGKLQDVLTVSIMSFWSERLHFMHS